MDLACELSMSLQRVKSETTSAEFVRWRRYLDDKVNRFHRDDYYLAQIAYEVHLSRNPKSKYRLKHFLFKFGRDRKPKTTVEERSKHSKGFWSGFLGLNSKE